MMAKKIFHKEYFNLRELAEYSGLGIRFLRDALIDPAHPLPCYRLNRKTILVGKSEFAEWLEPFRVNPASDLDRMVNLTLAELKK
jgi:hypothetical protein